MESAGHINKPWVLFAIVIAACCLCMMQSAYAGSIVGWGSNDYGEATPPDGNDFVAIAAGVGNSLALKSDGSIVGWGYNIDGQATPPDGNDFVAIDTGGITVNPHAGLISGYGLALKSDDSIVNWGRVYPPIDFEGNDLKAITAGHGYYLALKIDGSIAGMVRPRLMATIS